MYSTFDIIVSRSEREHMILSQLFFQSCLEQPVHDVAAGSGSPSLCKKWDWLFTSQQNNAECDLYSIHDITYLVRN